MERPDEKTPFDPSRITRPVPQLLTYYVIAAALTTVGFFVIFPILYFRYHTMRYAFDEKGISMSWGLLFRREIYLTYRRIQDIHVSRNFIQRHFGLASVAIQTASGSAGPEMTIEGVRDPEALRDYLYGRMRGAEEATEEDGAPDDDDEALSLLRAIRDEISRLKAGGGAA